MKTIYLTFQTGETCTITASDTLDIDHLYTLLLPLGSHTITKVPPDTGLYDNAEDNDECPCPMCQRTRINH